MIPYYILLVVILICIVLEQGSKSPRKRARVLMVSLIPVFLLLAFRTQEVGTDTANYFRAYTELSSVSIQSAFYTTDHFEPGYVCLNILLSKISNDPQTLLIAYALIVCISIYNFLNRTSQRHCLALLFLITLGFFQFAMTGIRQTLAMSILLWTYPLLINRKLLKFVLVVLLAMSFHKSAIIFVPAYFIANIKITRLNIAKMFVAILLLFFFADKLLLSAADIMEYNYGIEETGNGFIFFAMILIITLLCVNGRDRILNVNKYNRIAININFLSMALWCIRLVSRTAERVSLYFLPFTCVALEEYLSTRKPQIRNFYITCAVFLSISLFLYRLSGNNDLNNYQFCFGQ